MVCDRSAHSATIRKDVFGSWMARRFRLRVRRVLRVEDDRVLFFLHVEERREDALVMERPVEGTGPLVSDDTAHQRDEIHREVAIGPVLAQARLDADLPVRLADVEKLVGDRNRRAEEAEAADGCAVELLAERPGGWRLVRGRRARDELAVEREETRTRGCARPPCRRLARSGTGSRRRACRRRSRGASSPCCRGRGRAARAGRRPRPTSFPRRPSSARSRR